MGLLLGDVRHMDASPASTLLLLFSLQILYARVDLIGPVSCPCHNGSWCKAVGDRNTSKGTTEVFIYALQNKTWEHYLWDEVGGVIAVSHHDPELMCHAHSKGVKYGTLVTSLEFPDFGLSSEVEEWLDGLVEKVANQLQDILLLDLEQLFGGVAGAVLGLQAKRDFIRDVYVGMKSRIPHIKVGIVQKLQKTCNPEDLCHHVTLLANEVDYVVMTEIPNSQSDASSHLQETYTASLSSNENLCIAKPTAPYISVLNDLELYTSCGIPVEKLYLEVTWRGTDFPCHKFYVHNDTCLVSNCSGGLRRDLPDIMLSKAHHQAQRAWNRSYSMPYFNYFSTAESQWHQVWFEDIDSLPIKYNLARSSQLAGLVVWHGDALNYSAPWKSLTTEMWGELTNVKHTLTAETPSKWKKLTSEMTGLSISLFILGVFIGGAVVFSLHQCKRQRKRFRHTSIDDENQRISTEVH